MTDVESQRKRETNKSTPQDGETLGLPSQFHRVSGRKEVECAKREHLREDDQD